MVFYGSAVYGMYCFGILSRKWPKIMRRWESVEAKMPKHRSQHEKRKLARHLKMLAIIVLISSLGKVFKFQAISSFIDNSSITIHLLILQWNTF